MADPTFSGPQAVSQAQARLQELAQGLRETPHLDPHARKALADLLEELGRDLPPTGLPPEELTHLTETAAQLVETLRRRHDENVFSAARNQLERAVVRLELEAPFSAGVLRRLVDALASIGV